MESPRRRVLLSFARLSAPLVATIAIGCGDDTSSVCNVVCDDTGFIDPTTVGSTDSVPPDPDAGVSTTFDSSSTSGTGTSGTGTDASDTSGTGTEASGTGTDASGTSGTGTDASGTGTEASGTSSGA